MPTFHGFYGEITLTCSSQVNLKGVLLVSQTADFIITHTCQNTPPFPWGGDGGEAGGSVGLFTCDRFIKKIEVKIWWNVLIKAPGRRLYQKFISRSRMLASVKSMYSYGVWK